MAIDPAQLDLLRRRIANASRRADSLVAKRTQIAITPRPPQHLDGDEIVTPHGRHLERTRLWEHWRRHGSADVGALSGLPHDLLDAISAGEVPAAHPEKWAFLDTETTGLAGGSGTCAFLIGIGRITPRGFLVRQFFMRDFDEERSQLHAAAAELAGAEVIVTYNGKSFDLPLLETRYRMNRTRPPFARIAHLDLLHGARRLWRLRLDSCRLVDLESRILGHERHNDIAGELIPQMYFDYLRGLGPTPLEPVFTHNALDIVSLACLTAVVPWAFRDPTQAPVRHAAECVSLARWLRQSGKFEEALDLFRRGVNGNLADDLLFRTLWDIAELEKKLGRIHAALAIYTDLASARNPHRAAALVELAKHYEHRERNPTLALDFASQALSYCDSAPLRRRVERLERRAASHPARRLL
jgi:uncharacterized protein YprB with RNaseH-like and TPR domain